MAYRAYAGIGSRKTPEDIRHLMTQAATQLSYHDLILRSGGAEGADTAFEQGADRYLKEIYIPWNGFNGRYTNNVGVIVPHVSEEAYDLARFHHPNWQACSAGARKLHIRNCFQILGADLKTPALFVLCWTPGGMGTGGTGQAIRLATYHDVPVFDLGAMPLEMIEDRINQLIE